MELGDVLESDGMVRESLFVAESRKLSTSQIREDRGMGGRVGSLLGTGVISAKSLR